MRPLNFGGPVQPPHLHRVIAASELSPELYGDTHPRFFTYWTTDAYQTTGCYNLLCSGFVQTNNRIAIGAAISPTSDDMEGSQTRELVVGIWIRYPSWLLAGFPIHSPSRSHKHGSIRGRNCE
ncbi:putative MORC family CW-type zinc finger protein 3-like protein isoform X1 [Tanacetum coccineum]